MDDCFQSFGIIAQLYQSPLITLIYTDNRKCQLIIAVSHTHKVLYRQLCLRIPIINSRQNDPRLSFGICAVMHLKCGCRYLRRQVFIALRFSRSHESRITLTHTHTHSSTPIHIHTITRTHVRSHAHCRTHTRPSTHMHDHRRTSYIHSHTHVRTRTL